MGHVVPAETMPTTTLIMVLQCKTPTSDSAAMQNHTSHLYWKDKTTMQPLDLHQFYNIRQRWDMRRHAVAYKMNMDV
jgi:hypothetical protein